MKMIVGKVVVLGSQGVGKTSTCERYIQKHFNHQTLPTIGAAFYSTKITIMDKIVNLQIWDTAGQERFKAMAPMFYRNSQAAIVIFDITSMASFESMKGWVLELKRNVEESIVLVVLGNKIDLAEQRAVPRDEALGYSKTIGAHYFEVSAKEDQGVELVFDYVARELVKVCSKNSPTFLKRDHTDDINNIMAFSSELEPTDTANEELVNISINHIAHGDTVSSKCC
ncbi:ras-related protein Rab-31-like [Coccinella septempunctata]|uniref:ras-related protein Rab-31-like n=1 Tax=Coccinella septempunctata TaxID=41139 RepID=UPI001D0680BF|nr:ras-related protein Rab-31-like [Coccinella septempunctata]